MKKPSIFITSSEAIGNNQDLLTLLLLRIPTKPLLKFKCVSKRWLSLISSPGFCLSHTRHHQSNGFLTPAALILKWYYTFSSEFDVVPLKHNRLEVPFFHYMGAPNINVLQSCYGLFLCASLDYHGGISTYFICNPTTKKFKELSFPRTPLPVLTRYVSLAFDPLISPHYKIISIREVSCRLSSFRLDVYSSETDSWRVARIRRQNRSNSIHFEDAIFCNGKIHWKSYGIESLYFDVENESLEPMPMPKSTLGVPTQQICIGECRGALYAAVTYAWGRSEEFEVFDMVSDYSHWLLKHRLYIGDLWNRFIPQITCFPQTAWSLYNYGFYDVCMTQFENEEEPYVVVWIGNKVIFYDFDDGTWKLLHEVKPGFDEIDRVEEYYNRHQISNYQSIHANQYFENLSSI